MNLPYQTILDGANMATFWEFVKYFLFFIAPIIMIWVAIELAGRIGGVIKGAVHEGEDYDRRRRRYDGEDDDYYDYR